VTGFADTRRFQVVWKDGGSKQVEVDDAARRLYEGETIFEVAAAIACASGESHAQHSNIKDVKEV
jgi:hypothetical protein